VRDAAGAYGFGREAEEKRAVDVVQESSLIAGRL
jgi:hypothetical protein